MGQSELSRIPGESVQPPAKDSPPAFFGPESPYLQRNPEIEFRSEIVRRLLKDNEPIRIADIGCGDGRVSLPLLRENGKAVLLDQSAHMLDMARETYSRGGVSGNAEFVQGSLEEFSGTDPFDLVLCIGVLAHTNSVAGTIDMLSAMLGAGGVCILQFSDSAKALARVGRLTSAIVPDPYGYELSSSSTVEVITVAEKCGLRMTEAVRYWPVLPGMRRIFPYRWRVAYQQVTCTRSWLSQWGSEVICRFDKL